MGGHQSRATAFAEHICVHDLHRLTGNSDGPGEQALTMSQSKSGNPFAGAGSTESVVLVLGRPSGEDRQAPHDDRTVRCVRGLCNCGRKFVGQRQ